MINNIFIDSAEDQVRIRELFRELNLPEKQIQEFFYNGNLKLNGFQKSKLCNLIDAIATDKITSPDDVKKMQLLELSTMLVGPEYLNQLHGSLNDLTVL